MKVVDKLLFIFCMYLFYPEKNLSVKISISNLFYYHFILFYNTVRRIYEYNFFVCIHSAMKLCCYDVSVFKSNNETVNPDLERINGEAPTVDLNNHGTGVGFTLEFKQSACCHKYFGDLRDGKAHGRGELKVFNDGNLVYHYKGQFRNGVEHGMGEFKLFNKGKLLYHYKGQFKGGLSYNHMIAWNGGAYTGSLRRGKKWSGKTVLDNGSIRLYKEGERIKAKVTEATAASEFFSFMHASFVVFIYTLHLRLTFTLMIVTIHRR